jgi:molecular chaperone HtpG
MNMIKIPVGIQKHLEKDSDVHAYAINALTALAPWIQSNKTTFFPEYTDHGPKHIEEVLNSASGLITEEAMEIVSPSDAAVLIVAALLHDCALHITEDGFRDLVSGNWASNKTKFNESPWDELWDNFLSEAVRFDGRKLKALFGDTVPVRPPPASNYDQRDVLLIGEFLRRHHPRIARDIATFGAPGPAGQRLSLPEPSVGTKHIRDIAALVAESHGLDLRSAISRLEPAYDLREFKKIHAVYLMCILRISDYIQITADRAPSQLLQVKALQSPASKREWAAHASILDIRTTHDDPEAIYVQASPASASAYFKVKEWLAGIQKELDVSWAVLGEVYGRYGRLAALALTIRRIRSNLDANVDIQHLFDFALVDARFRAADSDLLKLLVAPLYGDRADVGIRELLQNAVDAVRERTVLPGESAAGTARDYGVSVSVRELSSGGIIEVSDSGSGMNLRILRDYFLTAGASYRKSDEWKKSYSDTSGKSSVLRAGRFGVGALAAFLLGDRMHVSTRHRTEHFGYQFDAGIEDEILEITKAQREVGTTIKIEISKETYISIKEGRNEHQNLFNPPAREDIWSWYCLSEPRVVFTVKETPINQLSA